MKRVVRILLVSFSVMVMSIATYAQNKVDEQRMERDIEVAENILSTLIKQQFGKRNIFPMEVNGTYMPGYGVTFHVPMEFGMPMIFMLKEGPDLQWNTGSGNGSGTTTYNYSYNVSPDAEAVRERDRERDKECEDCPKGKAKKGRAVTISDSNNDSLNNALNQTIVLAAKDFIADYGDLIGQLSPEEKIMITNRNDGNHNWYGIDHRRQKLLSIEGLRGDITAYKQSKLTRAQLLAKITVVNSETSSDLSPDLEILSSIYNKLYRADLSTTYYMQENIYYERLKDYGVIYYMQVYSSNENGYQRFSMPTQNLDNLTQEARDKKVIELYPAFEKDIKESMIDYGRTLKSLKHEENLIYNIQLTKCSGCGIPASLELSIKESVLEDYNSGKITKDAALAKINVKKGANQ